MGKKKLSAYQFLCKENTDGWGLPVLKDNLMIMHLFEYASTHDFREFEAIKQNAVGQTFFTIKIDLDNLKCSVKNNSSLIIHNSPISYWLQDGKKCFGFTYATYPLILQAGISDHVRIFYSPGYDKIEKFVADFRNELDTEFALLKSQCANRLNANIMFNDVEILGLYPVIY